MLKNFKIVLEYDGTGYHGWQKQSNTDMTIQAKLEALLKEMTGKNIEVHGSGRTDCGAHALGQTANFKINPADLSSEVLEEIQTDSNDTEICLNRWKAYMNRHLPDDIQILSLSEAALNFHSRHSAKEKTYCYRIRMSDHASVFSGRYETLILEPLRPDLMEQAAQKLIGTHDFKAFSTNRQPKKNTERTLYSVRFEKREDNLLEIFFTGNGFLYNMVRIITGTLIEIGTGRRKPDEMETILLSKDRKNAGYTAPACGLTLVCVKY